jgi:hypothetical protein
MPTTTLGFDGYARRALAASLLLFLVLGFASLNTEAAVTVTALSAKNYAVSGDDALVQVEVKPNSSTMPTIKLNDVDIGFDFAPAGTSKWIGIIKDLFRVTDPGAPTNTVTAEHANGNGSLTLTNYPIEGPIISGWHEEPFFCYEDFPMPEGLPSPEQTGDGKCGVEKRVDYFYQVEGNPGHFIHWPNATTATEYPNDVKNFWVNGKKVPYVVRLETATINRGIYQTAILYDVINSPAEPTALTRPKGWNGKLVYRFDGGCDGGWFTQGYDWKPTNVLDHSALSKRFAVAGSTLTVMGNNCNDLLSSETVMMVKERFIEAYGVPQFTIGTGGSGGSYQANQTADNYPGLLDGIIIGQAFADVTTSTLFKLFDSRLLENYLEDYPDMLNEEQIKAISGFRDISNITKSSKEADRIDPRKVFPPDFPSTLKYHPTGNKNGARATVYDHTRNVYGVVSSTTRHALRPIENVGIQYGLKALNLPETDPGHISVVQFIHLNKYIGGLNRDLKHVADRTKADPNAVKRAYQSGRILSGSGGLKTMPIIDRRNWADEAPNGDIHNKVHSFSIRERLREEGTIDAANHVMQTSADGKITGVDSLVMMDKWLSNIRDDTTNDPPEVKVVRNKPSTLKEGCEIDEVFYEEPQTLDGESICNGAYPAGTTPRIQAGAPIADNIVQCTLKDLDMADYEAHVLFSDEQLLELGQLFVEGKVCNWAVAGNNQLDHQTWRSFGPSTRNLIYQLPPQ